MYDSILVPTDGSEHATRAAEHARALADAFDATLHLVNVVDVAAAAGPFDAGGVDDEFVERCKAKGRETVRSTEAEAEAELGESERLRTDVVTGRPSDTILEYADDHGVDLIAMGTHGRSGLRRYVAGSVAERVVRCADLPVLTVRATDRSRVGDGYDDVLIPTDGSEHAAAAAEHGISIARTSGARVHAVHVVDVRAASATPRVTLPTTLMERLTAAGEEATETVASRARDAGLDATTHVTEGFPARDVLSYADENGVDLVAMGTAGRTGVERYLVGSTTGQVIRRAEPPVLSVRGGDAGSDS